MLCRVPKRIQRRRVRGWRMPPDTISVARPGKWGNPFRMGVDVVTAENCLELFEAYASARNRDEPEWLAPLRGKDLACWCKEGAPCHADVLLRLAYSSVKDTYSLQGGG